MKIIDNFIDDKSFKNLSEAMFGGSRVSLVLQSQQNHL